MIDSDGWGDVYSLLHPIPDEIIEPDALGHTFFDRRGGSSRILYVMTRPPLRGSQLEAAECLVAGAQWCEQWKAALASGPAHSTGPGIDDSALAAVFGHRAVTATIPTCVFSPPASSYEPPNCGVRVDMSDEDPTAVETAVVSAVAPRAAGCLRHP